VTVKIGTIRQGKFRRLVRKLFGDLRPAAIRETVGLLEMLWNHTAETCPRGDIGRDSDQDICDAIFWDDDPKKLIRALVKTGWIDPHPDPDVRLVIHDWEVHCPAFVKKNLKRNKKNFAAVSDQTDDQSVTSQGADTDRPTTSRRATSSQTPPRGSGGSRSRRRRGDPVREDTKDHLDRVAEGDG